MRWGEDSRVAEIPLQGKLKRWEWVLLSMGAA